MSLPAVPRPWRIVGSLTLLLASCLVVANSAASAPAGFAVKKHAPTKLTITVPSPYRMGFRGGVYILTARGRTLTFSRSVSPIRADQYANALISQIGGKVVFRAGGAAEYAVQIDHGDRREAFVVERRSGRLLVTTSSSKVSNPLQLEAIRAIGRSARGGVALRATQQGVGQTTATIALKPFHSPDGGSSALVPAEPGWQFNGGNGAVQGFNQQRGSFLLGYSASVFIPEAAPGPIPASFLQGPYMNAATALANIIPQISPDVTNVQVREIVREGVLPTYSSSGLFRFDYSVNGRRWTGGAIVGTDDPSKYGNLLWKFYYSGIGVPVGSDPAVGAGLMKVWGSWDPSRAIAQATSAQLQLIKETNQVWQQVSEFRSVTADRQSRDVGCLLQGYYAVEDNSRKFNLPPRPCGRIYVEGE